MKKSLVALALATGLIHFSFAQDNKEVTIEGNGKMATRDVAIQAFDALKASGIYELKITQGGNESVKLEGDENLLQYITVRNEGSKLIIDMNKLTNKNVNFKPKNKLRVYVNFKKLKTMELSMVGDVNSKDDLVFEDVDIQNKGVGNLDLKLTANKINLSNKGVGDVTLKGKAQEAVFVNSGVGSLQAGNFAVQTMTLQNSGVGSAEVNAEKFGKVKSTGMGSLRNKGTAPVPKKNNRAVEI